MARSLTASEICGRALRAIDAWPLSESAPDGEALEEALRWLDSIVKEVAGVRRMLSRVQRSFTFTLIPGQADYPMALSFGASYPLDGIQFPVLAWLQKTSGGRRPLPIVARDTWQAAKQMSGAGLPEVCYIDRLPSPTLSVFPVVGASQTDTYQVVLDAQTYTPDLIPKGGTGAAVAGAQFTGFGPAWERALIFRLSQDLGSGPIHMMPQQRLAWFERQYLMAVKELDAFENREHDNEPPIARSYDPFEETGPWFGGQEGRVVEEEVTTEEPVIDADGFTIVTE